MLVADNWACALLTWPALCSVFHYAGYYFRQKTYSEVERVLDAFKRDPNYKKKQRADGMGQPRMGGPPGEGLGQCLGMHSAFIGPCAFAGLYQPPVLCSQLLQAVVLTVCSSTEHPPFHSAHISRVPEGLSIDMGVLCAGCPVCAGYGHQTPAYGQPPGSHTPYGAGMGGYTPHPQQQQPGYGGGYGGGYGQPGQQPYRPAPPAAAAAPYGARPPGPGVPGGGYYQGMPSQQPQPGGYQSGYAPNPGYNPAAGGYQQPPPQPYGYGAAR